MIKFTGIYLLSCFEGVLGAWFLMKFGKALNLNDIPNHRSSHRKKIPKGAGFGILSALISVSLIVPIPFWFWVPAFIISICGFWGGDKHLLSPESRLIIQFGCSLFFLGFLEFSKGYDFGLASVLLGLSLSVFIVGTSNFYNFMDGIDGIAGTTGAIAFSLLGFYSYHSVNNEMYVVLSLSLSSACFGFLLFNLPKAKVFLGDVGSILIGFVFSCLIIVLSNSVVDFFVMAGFLFTFYFDELFTMVIRIRNGDSLLIPHRKHIYQILVNEFGICHWKITILYGVAQFIIGLSLIAARDSGIRLIFFLYLLYFFVFVLFGITIHRKVVAKCELK